MSSKYLLALNAHEKIGSQTMKKALAPFSDNSENLWKASNKELEDKLNSRIAGLIIEARNKFSPEEELAKLQRLNIGYMTLYDKEYPELLKEIPDCPVVLYVRGNIEALKKLSLGVVGSRKFTAYGKTVAYKFSKECTENGLAIISGLALGIDAVAHRAALDAKGITVGVLGCGLDKIYPSSNSMLGREIIESGGAVVSEFPPGTPPMKQNFPARNRIIAGLSRGILVVEAAEKSGALITAYQALEYNRDVYAVPGNIDSETSKGTNLLIQKGAKLIAKTEDILEEFNIEAREIENKNKEMMPETEEERVVCDLLKNGKKIIDEIVLESKLNIVILNTTLTMMEMKGIVENCGGGFYNLKI